MSAMLSFAGSRHVASLVSALVSVLCLGCGTAAYHERMEGHLQSLIELQASQPAVNLSMFYQAMQESQLPGDKRVNLRIPQCFTKNDFVFHEQVSDSRTSKSYLPPRLWPLGVEIPGYYWTYEASISEEATKPIPLAELNNPRGNETRWSYSFSFGALQASPDIASEAMLSYLQELNLALANTTGANPSQIDLEKPELIKEVEIQNQQKEQIRWKVLHLEADMFFTSFQGREEKSWEKKLGVVEIYSTYHKQHLVILAGNWIKGMEASTLMQDYLPVIASTVTLNDDGLTTQAASE